MAFETIATRAELQDEQRIWVTIDNVDVVVFWIDGKVYAIQDLCTHDGGDLGDGKLTGGAVVCPRHGARFDLETGKPTAPAFKPVPRYATQFDGDDVQVDIEQRINS